MGTTSGFPNELRTLLTPKDPRKLVYQNFAPKICFAGALEGQGVFMEN